MATNPSESHRSLDDELIELIEAFYALGPKVVKAVQDLVPDLGALPPDELNRRFLSKLGLPADGSDEEIQRAFEAEMAKEQAMPGTGICREELLSVRSPTRE